ncbi:flagellar basal body-associated FliL family protein [Methylosinus sp. Sm6]|uniref:flagellar basal body-associated FliL family protein n=1 Tax=Methylosinus sp. Sm6 TaxID=2866948 RepID=UPI001C99B5DA|nr:flagellar basal body-associated FliL family protein [Methylosinus sp. Sm6]MBY6240599.1 flagellar basal body-associated FliL family protein [Methylosinus sp. Sm6]
MAGPPASSSPAPPSSSSMQTVVALVVATLVAVGGGGFLGMTLVGEQPAAPAHGDEAKESAAASRPAPEPADKGHGGGGHGAAAPAAKEAAPPAAPKWKLKELAPIVTNLADPEMGWVRMQAAIVYDGEAVPQTDLLVSQVTADIVAFLRTMTLASIQGADGLRRLHEDLSERAVIRSEGRIRELIIQALVVQ